MIVELAFILNLQTRIRSRLIVLSPLQVKMLFDVLNLSSFSRHISFHNLKVSEMN